VRKIYASSRSINFNDRKSTSAGAERISAAVKSTPTASTQTPLLTNKWQVLYF
jgi:hypothetical protein